jgi:hypothetical protein
MPPPVSALAEAAAIAMAVALPAVGVIFCGLWIVAVAVPVAKRLRRRQQHGGAGGRHEGSLELANMAAGSDDDTSMHPSEPSSTSDASSSSPGTGKRSSLLVDDPMTAADMSVYVGRRTPASGGAWARACILTQGGGGGMAW